MRRVVACALVSLAACRETGLMSSAATLRFDPDTLNFGAVYAGHEHKTLTVRLRNDGKTPVALEWGVPGAPFEVGPLPETLPSGVIEIPIDFSPAQVGSFTQVLRVDGNEGAMGHQVTLLAEARAVPDCPPAKACFRSSFDFAQKRCVEEPLANDTVCDPGTACIVNPTCQAGRCVGQAKSCDDQNLCTIDTCNAVIGCEHLPAPPCPGDGACQLGVCNPATGCGFADAPDGVSCGAMRSCDAAQVCIGGACVVRDPPDGYVCAEASPCQGEGYCQADTCVRPPATVLTASWNYDSRYADAGYGLGAPQYHDILLEPSGAVTVSGFMQAPALIRANTPTAKQVKDGKSRRCLLWNDRLVCADVGSGSGTVSAIDMGTGTTLWTFSLAEAKPDFRNLTSSLFMARLAVQGSDRLAALFEAYPKSSGSNPTNCRMYFLAVLDAAGKMISAQQVLDPMLTVCDHPHPYGFGTDALGDLFISFSPTTTNMAPLVPGKPTMLMSYTRDGVFRWKRTDPELVGGELAVARGLLYPENGTTAVLTATGEAAFSLEQPFGRAVVTRQRTVLSPVLGEATLDAYEAGTETKRWQHKLPAGHVFASDQLRLASWQTRLGAQTVALTFTTFLGKTMLHGVVARDGSEAFTCEVAINGRTDPHTFEVAEGTMTVMEGAGDCEKCDPPFAGSMAGFHTVSVPLLSPANVEPWVGTFGGAGHDHHEESPGPAGPN